MDENRATAAIESNRAAGDAPAVDGLLGAKGPSAGEAEPAATTPARLAAMWWAGTVARIVTTGALAFYFAVPLEAWLTRENVPAYLQVVVFYLAVVVGYCALTSPLVLYARIRQPDRARGTGSWWQTLRVLLIVNSISLAYYMLAFAAIRLLGEFWWPAMMAIGFYFFFSHHYMVSDPLLKKSEPLGRDAFPRLVELAERAGAP